MGVQLFRRLQFLFQNTQIIILRILFSLYTELNYKTINLFVIGGSDDWAKGGAGVKFSYTVELPDTGKHGFILPAQ